MPTLQLRKWKPWAELVRGNGKTRTQVSWLPGSAPLPPCHTPSPNDRNIYLQTIQISSQWLCFFFPFQNSKGKMRNAVTHMAWSLWEWGHKPSWVKLFPMHEVLTVGRGKRLLCHRITERWQCSTGEAVRKNQEENHLPITWWQDILPSEFQGKFGLLVPSATAKAAVQTVEWCRDSFRFVGWRKI